MRYYIVNEVTIALKKKGTYIYAAGIIILSLLANIAMVAFRSIYGMREGAFGANLIYFAQWCFIVPYYSTILIAEIIFGKECNAIYILELLIELTKALLLILLLS